MLSQNIFPLCEIEIPINKVLIRTDIAVYTDWLVNRGSIL